MQERSFVAVANACRHVANETGTEPLPAIGGVGAHGTDLGPAGRVQPFAGHRNQSAVSADAEIVAELDRPRRERSRSGTRDQLENLRHIGVAEPDGLVVGLCAQRGGDKLRAVHNVRDLPAVWGLRDARQDSDSTWSKQPGEIQPTLGIGSVGEGGEGRDVRRIASGTNVSLGEIRMSSGQ